MPKRIVLLLDGTWNDADAKGVADTNIVRLREIIARCLDRTPASGAGEAVTPASGAHQSSVIARTYSHNGKTAPKEHLIYYERGVGTGGFLNVIGGGAFAIGLAQNIRRAYLFLAQNYNLGDEILIFGFSRGSYTARSLVGYIGVVGLLMREFCNPINESKAWYYYRTHPADRLPSTRTELSQFTHPQSRVRVKCLGVFDTVGALGVPVPMFWRENRDLFEFHDVSLSHISDVNLHALAIDEHRESFEPTPWRQQKFGPVATQTEQVWFPGAHADIGGGYVDEEQRQTTHLPALDDVSLDWMLKRVLHYYPDFPVNQGGAPAWPKISSDWVTAPQHEARGGFYKLRPFALRSIGNCSVPTRPGFFESNVCRDRHANPVGEMVHVSAIERLGCPIGKSRQIYAPRNLLAALDTIKTSYTGSAPDGSSLRIADWSGQVLSIDQANAHLDRAQARLSPSGKFSYGRRTMIR